MRPGQAKHVMQVQKSSAGSEYMSTFASIQDRGSPADRSTQFVPVESGGAQTTDAGTFMVLAYSLMWLATVAFIVHTWRKMRGVQDKVERLERALSEEPSGGN